MYGYYCVSAICELAQSFVIDNVCSIHDLQVYGNEGCDQETHTAQGAAECCMGLETTTQVPVSHV